MAVSPENTRPPLAACPMATASLPGQGAWPRATASLPGQGACPMATASLPGQGAWPRATASLPGRGACPGATAREARNGQALVSVVIAAYNRERCIREAIDSVLAQKTAFPYEVIVVDDGSTDRTADVARSCGRPVRVISKDNGGPASARNAGVLAAQSSLIAFLDSDDLMLPGRLARQADFLRAHPEVVLAFGDIISDAYPGGGYLNGFHKLRFEPGHWLTVDKPYQRLLTRGNFVPNQTTMFRKDDYVRAGMMDESLRVSEDWELWSRMTSMGQFAYYCAPFARVRRHMGNHLMASSHRCTDMARALHRMLLRDQVLHDREKQESLALLRELLRQLLRYDLLQRGRRQMLNDLREMGSWFGRWHFLKWWVVSLIPSTLAKFISRLRSRRARTQEC